MPWTETDKAYLAGLIDGEGCVGVYVSEKRSYRPRLSITNTNKEVLDWVAETFGGYVTTRSNGNGCKTVHRWNAHGATLPAQICAAVLPYLKIKSDQARLILSFPAHVQCNQWTVEKTEKLRAEKHALYLKTKELNRRGDHALAA